MVLDNLLRWVYVRSLWMVHFCSACGAVEFPMLVMAPLDWERYGYMPTPSPRQSDLYIGMGYLTKKTVKLFLNMYRQVPEPRLVLAGCNCTSTGGLYWDSYATYKRLDDFVEVEGWVPGCMPMPDDYLSMTEYIRRDMGKRPFERYVSRIKPDAFKKIAEWEDLERKWREEYEKKMREEASKPLSYEFKETYPSCYEEDKELGICKTSIDPSRIRGVLGELKEKGYVLFVNINTVDYPDKGVIELYYIVENPANASQTWVKTYVRRSNPEIDTVSDIYPLAKYIEREVYEFMGVSFRNNDSLSKWILDGNWEGPPPLRKDVDTAGFVVKNMYGGYKYGR